MLMDYNSLRKCWIWSNTKAVLVVEVVQLLFVIS